MYGYENDKIGFCVLWMLVIGIIIHTLAFLNLWRTSTKYLQVKEPPTAAAGPAKAEQEEEADDDAAGEKNVKVAIPPPSQEEEDRALEVSWRNNGLIHIQSQMYTTNGTTVRRSILAVAPTVWPLFLPWMWLGKTSK